jgi:hypothetical protein
MSFEYLTLEWLWDSSSLRITSPIQPEKDLQGSYQEVVDILTSLGNQGWKVCGYVTNANWIFRTMKKQKQSPRTHPLSIFG